MLLQGSASCTWPVRHGFGATSRGPHELRPARRTRWVVRAKKSFYEDPASLLSIKVRRRLERLLPLTPSDEPSQSSTSSLEAANDQATRSAEKEVLPTQPELRRRKPDVGAGSAVEVEQHHGHHEHQQGQLTKVFDQTLANFGIELSERTKGLLCLNLLVLLYATNWVVIKDSNAAFDPYAFSFLRFTAAAAAFSPFLSKAFKDPRIVRAGVELGIWTAAGYLLQSEGLLTTDASRASFLSTFTVIVVPILAGLSGRGVQTLTWVAAVAALGGMSLLEGGGAPPCIGDVWSFLSALAFGVQVFRTEHWARTLGPRHVLPLMSVVLGVTMVTAMGVAAVANPGGVMNLLQHPGLVQTAFQEGQVPWQAALYTGLLTTDLCLLLELIALRNVSSTDAAIIYSLEPVLGAALAFVVLGERWGPLGWVGASLIIGSSLATQLYGKEEGEPIVESASESDME